MANPVKTQALTRLFSGLTVALFGLVALQTFGACKKQQANAAVSEKPGGAATQVVALAESSATKLAISSGGPGANAGLRLELAVRRSAGEDDYVAIQDAAAFVFDADTPYDINVRVKDGLDRLVATAIQGSSHCAIPEKQVFQKGTNMPLQIKLCQLVLEDRAGAPNPGGPQIMTVTLAPQARSVAGR